jgi:L-lactate dehydrogenase
VWGAGNLGTALVRRLTLESWVDEVHWINRTHQTLQAARVDIEHGLAFAPSCRAVYVHPQAHVPQVHPELDLLVLTAGQGAPGGDRYACYPDNRDLFLGQVIPALSGFGGVALVVSNPVDLMARLLHVGASVPAERVVGLGTLVETARLKAALAGHLDPVCPARDMPGIAVGTHDERFIPVVERPARLSPEDFEDILSLCRHEVAEAARRVKRTAAKDGEKRLIEGTLHPIVEGAVRVLRAVAVPDDQALTVSVLDPGDPDRLFYSAPCLLGREGVRERRAACFEPPAVANALRESLDPLRAVLRQHPD